MTTHLSERRSPFLDELIASLFSHKRQARGWDHQDVSVRTGLPEDIIRRAETHPALVLTEVLEQLFDFYEVAPAIRRAIGRSA